MDLSTEDIRRWCLGKTRRGARKHVRSGGREFATKAFLRAIGVDNTDFFKWLHGKKAMSAEKRRAIARFIEKWENGLLEFATVKGNGKRALVHRTTPRPIATRMIVDFSGRAPRVVLQPRPKFTAMPSFPELAGTKFDKR